MLNSISQFFATNWPLVLKLSTATISGTLGIVALMNDFKDKNGRLNRWGKLSLLGLVMASLIGVVTEVVDANDQAEKERDAKRVATRQLDHLETLSKEMTGVLQSSQTLQSGLNITLTDQARLLDENQRTFREVERGFTPLGENLFVDYELELPATNQRFAAIPSIAAQVVDEFTRTPPAPSRETSFWTSVPGVGLSTQGWYHKVSSVIFSPETVVQFGAWPSQVMANAPFVLKVWKKPPAPSWCETRVGPDAVFGSKSSFRGEGDAADHANAIEGGTGDRIENVYTIQAKTLIQSGRVKFGHRLSDDGVIQSPLDFDGALLAVTLGISGGAARMPDDPGALISFDQLTISLGHVSIKLNAGHPTGRCGSDLYFLLPRQLSAMR